MAYVRTRLGRLFYEERGAAKRPGDPAIVLLHGLLFDGGMWRHQIEPLTELGRVVAFDGPGHGKSEPAPRFMLEEHADALFDAFGELGIRRAIVVGHSWGGMVGMRLALQHPAQVAGLGLIDSSAEVDPLHVRVKYRALIAMYRRIGMPYAVYERELAPLLFGPRTRATNRDLVESSYRRAAGFDRDGLAPAAIAVVVHRKKILPSLDRVRVPTLVLCGRDDASTSPERSEAIAKAIPHAKLVLVEDAGHLAPLESPDIVTTHLKKLVGNCLRDL